MNAKHCIRRASQLIRSPWSIALICALGIHVTGSSATAQWASGSMDLRTPNPEPMYGQTAYSQSQGTAQMTLEGSHERSGDARYSQVMGRVKYGITDRLQAQALVPMEISDQRSNFTAQSSVSHGQIGAQYAITTASDPVALSAAFDVDVPLGSQQSVISRSQSALGSSLSAGPTFKPALMAATGVGNTQFQANAQAELGQATRALNYNIGAAHSIGNWAPSVELNARSAENAHSSFYATPGLYYSFSDRATLGAGVSVGLNKEATPVGLMAKFSMQLGR